ISWGVTMGIAVFGRWRCSIHPCHAASGKTKRAANVSVELRLEDVGKTFSPSLCAVADVNLTVAPGECLALVGPSGCGKTTLLRLIAGLERPSAGRILIDGRCVNELPPHQRGVAMLFQRPALIPQQTVRRNLRWA